MTPRRALLSLLALAGPAAAQPPEQRVGELVISAAWTRAAGANANGAGYLTIRNDGAAADRLLAASTAAARRVELHTMLRDGDVMRMRAVPSIELPPGQTVTLRPGGLHVMLLGLAAPLEAGGSLPLTLRFERAGEVEVRLAIGRAGAAGPPHGR